MSAASILASAMLLLPCAANDAAPTPPGGAAPMVVPDLAAWLRGELVALQAAEVHVGDGTVHKPGIVLVQDGKVVAAGAGLPLPAGGRVIDCGDAIITPGLVDPACQLGTHALFGSAEQASEVIPHLDTGDALDYFSRDFEDLVAGGVTTVFVTGEASAVISARGAAVKTAGPIADRRLPSKACVKVTLGPESSGRGVFNRSPSRFGGGASFANRRPTTRMGAAWVFRKAFHDAIAWRDEGRPSSDGFAPAALTALGEVLTGATALRMQVREAMDFDTTARLADEFGLKYSIEYGTEAAQRLDLLARRGVAVIFGPVRASDSTFEGYESAVSALETPKLLAEKGIPFCLTASDGNGDGGLARQAGLAIRHGLDRARALRAVTADSAAICGLEQRVGRLTAGLDADLVVWNGAPFDDTSKPVLVLIQGRPVVDPQGRFRKENS
jgi:imidazolonepropionase-like amidohydrolase